MLQLLKHYLYRTLSLYRPHAITLDNASRDKKDIHGPKIIWFIPADKRLPLVAVPIKHAPANFVKYHEEYKNRIFIVSFLAIFFVFFSYVTDSIYFLRVTFKDGPQLRYTHLA